MTGFESVATEAAPTLGAAALLTLADRIGAGWPESAVLSEVGRSLAEAGTEQ